MTYTTELNPKEISSSHYRASLHPWVIARLRPNMQWTVLQRFRSRTDADGYLKFLRQRLTSDHLMVMFDAQMDQAVAPAQ